MADATSSSITIGADPERVMAVIADFAAYPEWAEQVKTVEVLDVDAAGRPERVRFQMDAGPIKDNYTLDYSWAPDGRSVSWTLVSSGQQRSQDASYTLTPDGDKTKVVFEISVDPVVPLPGFVLKRAIKGTIDTGTKGLRDQVLKVKKDNA